MFEVIALIAIAHVWARGTIFAPLRAAGGAGPVGVFWRALADCPLCAGVWIGMLGHHAFALAPRIMATLGTGAIVGTGALAVYGLIRRI